MANVLKREKQQQAVRSLVEGSSVRSTERMIGVHRDTILRLLARVGHGCERLMDTELRNLSCRRIQVDEVWGFIAKKQRHVMEYDDPKRVGDYWTYVAIDAGTKLIPAYLVGKRDRTNANAFMNDLASRMSNRIQLSSDAMQAYVDAVPGRQTPGHLVQELTFGFWVRLCNRPCEHGRKDGPELWPAAAKRFYRCPRKQRNREDIGSALGQIADLRNRVAHHHPIWDRRPDKRLGEIAETVGWQNPGLADAIQQTSTVGALHAAGHKPFRDLAAALTCVFGQ